MNAELLTPDHHNAILQAVASQHVEPMLSAADIDALIRHGEAAALSLKAYAKICKQTRFLAGDHFRESTKMMEQSLLAERVAASIAATTADAKILKLQTSRKRITKNSENSDFRREP